jgi:hypothetical protein
MPMPAIWKEVPSEVPTGLEWFVHTVALDPARRA